MKLQDLQEPEFDRIETEISPWWICGTFAVIMLIGAVISLLIGTPISALILVILSVLVIGLTAAGMRRV